MGIPMVKCALCGKDVTKRQSLLIEPYGRICREHPEVEQHKEKLAQQAAAIKAKLEENKAMEETCKKAAQVLNIISMTQMIRVLAYQSGQAIELVWLVLRDRIPESIREEVLKELVKQGPTNDEEMTSSLMTYLNLRASAGV